MNEIIEEIMNVIVNVDNDAQERSLLKNFRQFLNGEPDEFELREYLNGLKMGDECV